MPTRVRHGHGLTWYEFDINWIEIKLLRKGLIKDIYAGRLNTDAVKDP